MRWWSQIQLAGGGIVLAICAAGLPIVAASAQEWGVETENAVPIATVDHVDLERYQGLWYEIAKIPNRFQKNCARGTTAEYRLREDGRLTVINQCIEADGQTNRAEGVAKVEDKESGAKLKVSFVSFLGWRPFWGDYWILGLATDYGWAVVGTPDRKYGWILARTPKLEDAAVAAAFAVLERNGYRRDQFEMGVP
jgi:apolipoprotein D and lipocalin family protein